MIKTQHIQMLLSREFENWIYGFWIFRRKSTVFFYSNLPTIFDIECIEVNFITKNWKTSSMQFCYFWFDFLQNMTKNIQKLVEKYWNDSNFFNKWNFELKRKTKHLNAIDFFMSKWKVQLNKILRNRKTKQRIIIYWR